MVVIGRLLPQLDSSHHQGWRPRSPFIDRGDQEESLMQAEERDQEAAASAATEQAEREQFEQR